jgi:DNA gyrase subunit B
VRRRPGMYIGTTGPDGLHHLIWEVFDNSRDEAMGGFADDIEVVLLPGNTVRVADNGRGIPVDIHKQTKVSALETVMTDAPRRRQVRRRGLQSLRRSPRRGCLGRQRALNLMRAEVHRDGGAYVQEYAKGKKKAAVKKVALLKTPRHRANLCPRPRNI